MNKKTSAICLKSLGNDSKYFNVKVCRTDFYSFYHIVMKLICQTVTHIDNGTKLLKPYSVLVSLPCDNQSWHTLL